MVYRVGVKHMSHFLGDVDIFRGLSERHLDRIAGLCEERQFKTGEYLGIQKELGNSLHVIRQGRITITTGPIDAGTVVRTVGPLETLHLSVLFEPPIIMTTARADTDGEALVIPRTRIFELCELEPRIGMQIYKAVCGIVIGRYRYMLDQLPCA